MYKIVTKLSASQEKEIKKNFLKTLGRRLKEKRTVRSVSQAEIGKVLSLDATSISKYESGDQDMNVSLLPLYSVYYDFPLYELFPRAESRELLNTFSEAVKISSDRKKRKQVLTHKKEEQKMYQGVYGKDKVLKAQIYEIDGKEERVDVKIKEKY